MPVGRRNIKITVEYDGASYFGWQRQPNHMTIQQRLEEAVEAVTQAHTTVHGSGRTDTGVHARGQVAHLHTESSIPPEKFPYALNAHLPHDIAVLSAEDVAADFHARFSALSKTYAYTILNQPIRSPTRERYATRVWPAVDVSLMQQAASCLVGEHDFAAFQSEGSRPGSTVRCVTRAELASDPPLIVFWIEANGFLYNMVRAIVGTLLLVGHGKVSPSRFRSVLESGARDQAGPTAPARGLCLMQVTY